MYFPTAHFLFCNSEIFYNDRLKLISKISIEKKCAAEEHYAAVALDPVQRVV